MQSLEKKKLQMAKCLFPFHFYLLKTIEFFLRNFVGFVGHLLDGFYVRNIELQHVLNSILQGHHRTGATGAGSLQF